MGPDLMADELYLARTGSREAGIVLRNEARRSGEEEKKEVAQLDWSSRVDGEGKRGLADEPAGVIDPTSRSIASPSAILDVEAWLLLLDFAFSSFLFLRRNRLTGARSTPFLSTKGRKVRSKSDIEAAGSGGEGPLDTGQIRRRRDERVETERRAHPQT